MSIFGSQFKNIPPHYSISWALSLLDSHNNVILIIQLFRPETRNQKCFSGKVTRNPVLPTETAQNTKQVTPNRTFVSKELPEIHNEDSYKCHSALVRHSHPVRCFVAFFRHFEHFGSFFGILSNLSILPLLQSISESWFQVKTQKLLAEASWR